ncbi:MAG: RidA family protein [Candidatus Latescibacteria bacterium]|nr:RidA family protein [Candidatus Latescibacterota bacterium]
MMEKRDIKTSKAPEPVGPYSQAVKTGDFIFCSGQIALDPKTGELLSDSIEAETTLVMENLKAVLEAAGSSLERVVKTTIFVTDMNDFGSINAVYGSFFGGSIPPARATVQVASLPKGARVEVECIALSGG